MNIANGIALVMAILRLVSPDQERPTPAELQVLRETNAYRAEYGLEPVVLDPRLMRAARNHAWNMSERGVMSHNFRGSSPMGRAREQGFYGMVRENIAQGFGPESVVGVAWMNSPPHRANLLSPSTTMGVGMVWNRGRWWACQVLGQ